MALNASKVSGGEKSRIEQEVLEPGVYPGRLVQVLDLGLQAQRAFQGKNKPPAQEIMLTYELVDTFMKDAEGNELEGNPRWISEAIPLHNLVAEKAKSTQRYLALDKEKKYGGDFSQCVDIPINITLVNNAVGDKVYVNVAGIAAMRPKDADKCPALVNPPKVFDLDVPDMEIFLSLPEWVQTKIKSNLNFNGSALDVLLKGGKVEAKKEENKEEEDEDAPW